MICEVCVFRVKLRQAYDELIQERNERIRQWRKTPHTSLWLPDQAITSQMAKGSWGGLDDIGGAISSLFSEDNPWVNSQRIEILGDIFL